jgi:hypothetical protein
MNRSMPTAAPFLLALLLGAGCAAADADDEYAPAERDAGKSSADTGETGTIFAPEDTFAAADTSGSADASGSADSTAAADTYVDPGDTSTPPADTYVAPADTFTPPAARNIWAMNGYCGAYGGTCPAHPTCPTFPTGTAGQTCSVAFERCLAPGAGTAATKVFACVPTGKTSWDFNSLHLSAWGAVPGTFPTCASPATGVAGSDCATVGDRCVSGEKLFRCLPGGFKMWVFNGHCSTATKPISWEGDCSGVSFPTCTATSVAGSPCGVEFDRCLSDNKIFRCVSR